MNAAAPIVVVDGLGKRFPNRATTKELLRRPLKRNYGVHQVLDGVRFEVRADECFGLLGPNGAGKTTLFKVLSTLILPDAGRATVDGHDVVARPRAVRRALTPVIADERSLNWRLSGRQNLALYGALYGLTRDRVRDETERLLSTVGLKQAREKMVGTYSSGMKQRLLIARALLSRPKVLLLDEPTRSLDPIKSRDFRQFLREEIIARQGCAVLLATHNSEEAFELCDRLAVLNEGRLVAQGTAAELARQVGSDRLRVVVPDSDTESASRVMAAAGGQRIVVTPTDEAGWTALTSAFSGDMADAATLSDQLFKSGVRVAELTRAALPLADLIDRVVRQEPS